jgi:putative ABC transport system substrate-binding protein
MMGWRRREFIELFGGALMAWPLTAQAQRSLPVIGFINPNSPESFAGPVAAFKEGLRETGLVEGQNVIIEFRWAEGRYDRLPELTSELVRRGVAVIAATGGGDAAYVAKTATTTIPIVFNSATDPVAAGLVASLSRPGGNLTGVSRLSVELMPKRLELLREAVPNATTLGLLVNPRQAGAEDRIRRAQTTAQAFNWQTQVLNAGTDGEIETAFATLEQFHIGALLIDSNSFFNARSSMLGALTLRHAVPAIYQSRAFVAGGGLMSYGANLDSAYRLMGSYAGRIIKGEKPAELPVQQQTKVDFIVSLKTAKALGVTFSLPLIGRADEVIE